MVCLREGIGRVPYKDEGPWQLIVLTDEEVHEIPDHARYDDSRDELA